MAVSGLLPNRIALPAGPVQGFRTRAASCHGAILIPRTAQIQKKDIARLDRILALLGSDHPGERAAAALKAVAFLKRHELSWLDVLEGRALPRGNVRPRRLDSSDDDLKAAESRLRQMRAHNDALERQIKRLKTTIDALQPPK
jgi:septal ring factor EnvC (AmiA/AmiB activator)